MFDCDGVLVDTEKDGHRVTFNQAFAEKGLDAVWGVAEYGELVKIGGGKERMTKCARPSRCRSLSLPSERAASELGLNAVKPRRRFWGCGELVCCVVD